MLPLAPAAALVTALAVTSPVHATGTTITVTNFGDGDGTCPSPTSCTLRAAVNKANDETGDTIVVPAGTYVLNNFDAGSIWVTSSMTISGAGAGTTTVEGVCNGENTWSDRLFTISPDGTATVAISGVTLTNGAPIGTDVNDGGAVLAEQGGHLTMAQDVVTGNAAGANGGGIAAEPGSTLDTLQTIVKNNQAGAFHSQCSSGEVTHRINFSLNPGNQGGGVYSAGPTTMTSTSVASNQAGGDGGGVYLASPEGVTDTLTQVFVHGNTAMQPAEAADVGGGGIYADIAGSSHVVVNQSTISANTATLGSGGGIYADFSSFQTPTVAHTAVAASTPDLTVSNTTLNGNTAALSGGGVYLHGGINASFLNDTLYGNKALGGGGLAVGQAFQSQVTVESVTDDANSALGNEGGGLLVDAGKTTLHNSVVAANTITPLPTIAAVLHNCQLVGEVVSLVSLGYNLSDDSTCHLVATGDQQPGVPGLGPLQDNGGPIDGATGDTSPTLTQAFVNGSTAPDRGDPNNFPATDERGTARPQPAPSPLVTAGVVAPRVSAKVAAGARADVGSYEAFRAATPGTINQPTLGPSPTTGVQGIIAVPSTGGDPSGSLPAVAALVAVSLLTAGVGVAAARRRR